MSSNRITGTNFSLIDGVVDFFGAKAIHTDKLCAVNFCIGGDIMIRVDPNSSNVKECILECIEEDIKAGRRDDVAYVIVGNRYAASLYIDKVITEEHLRNATEGDDYVDLPGVAFGDFTLTVRVDPSVEPNFCATADKDCVVIQ